MNRTAIGFAQNRLTHNKHIFYNDGSALEFLRGPGGYYMADFKVHDNLSYSPDLFEGYVSWQDLQDQAKERAKAERKDKS